MKNFKTVVSVFFISIFLSGCWYSIDKNLPDDFYLGNKLSIFEKGERIEEGKYCAMYFVRDSDIKGGYSVYYMDCPYVVYSKLRDIKAITVNMKLLESEPINSIGCDWTVDRGFSDRKYFLKCLFKDI
tara:strand:- start:6784 stop:7167 length:384 start_codon:yes stop_codon:yes gene_type:complete